MECASQHNGEILWVHKKSKVVDCVECGYAHVLPLPGKEELEKFYAEDFYTNEIPSYIQSNITDQNWWKTIFQSRLDYIQKMLPSELGKSVIDIGSGPGFFLKFAQESGWNALGVEPSKVAVEHTKSLGANVIEGFFDHALAHQLDRVSALHASEVLEHVPNPGEMLDWFNRILLPKGVMCLCVPNDFNPFQKALVQIEDYPKWWISPTHHLNYFKHQSLKTLVEKHGFIVEKITSTFPIDIFLMMGDSYIGNDEVGKSCHKKRMNFEFLLNEAGLSDLKNNLYEKFAECELGREVIIYARKV